MDTSLFTTRQITDYRDWPSGLHGCLFYVADVSFDEEYTEGALYLIDAPYRKGDELGKYDTLHQSEKDNLRGEHPILKGFAAFLLTQDHNQWSDQNVLDKWWTLYYDWCRNVRLREGLETEYMLSECWNWITRVEQIVNSLLFTSDLKFNYTDALSFVIRNVIVKNTSSVMSSITNWCPYIKLSEKNTTNTESDYIYYDYHTNAMMCGSTIFVSGMQAIILHFSVIHRVTQSACKVRNLWRLANFILQRFSNNTSNKLALSKVNILDCSVEKARKLYDFAWEFHRGRLMSIYEQNISFHMLSEQQREWELVNRLCNEEIEHYQNKKLLNQLSPVDALKMRKLLSGFFLYLFGKLEGSKYAPKLYADLMNLDCFPGVEAKDVQSSNVKDRIYHQYFNVQGDYIAGDKHVGAHIDRVQPGGIGAQTNKE